MPASRHGTYAARVTETPTRIAEVLRLSSGRDLGYAEYGVRGSTPLLVFHGLPGSRLDAPEMWTSDPTDLWIIAPDRSGVGLSTFHPNRRLLDWADDVRELCDSLGIDRFLVAGFSGGGPHALAVAHGLPERVIAVASIAGVGMLDNRASLVGMNRVNRVVFTLARRAPRALWLVAAPHARQVKRNPAKAIDAAAKDKHLPQSDRDVMANVHTRAAMIAAGPEAFRQGVRGFIQEAHVVVSPWGFDPSAIAAPVSFWQGAMDTNVPIESVRRLAESIPNSTLHVLPGEGHLIVPRHWSEIVGELRSAERPSP